MTANKSSKKLSRSAAFVSNDVRPRRLFARVGTSTASPCYMLAVLKEVEAHSDIDILQDEPSLKETAD